ncbi:unnamed protein product [Microthlaspi erraticum]|uniref:Uncharacterized protein n=1 Tax=Microthlaspi erraticum TaxID=1685480 RepID=A0A6D2I9F0_9BRAS|nr:unnamed protein product [Microthlaspi erraticum]
MFFPWATEAADKFHVPRLVFHGKGYFALCSEYCIRVHKPHKRVGSSCEPFVIPDLPGNIVITQEQIADRGEESEMGKFMTEVTESEVKSSGVIVNSFYDLEPDYVDFYKSSEENVAYWSALCYKQRIQGEGWERKESKHR